MMSTLALLFDIPSYRGKTIFIIFSMPMHVEVQKEEEEKKYQKIPYSRKVVLLSLHATSPDLIYQETSCDRDDECNVGRKIIGAHKVS